MLHTQERSGLAFQIVAVSLGLGLTGAVLLRPAPWGANFPVWVLISTLCAYGLLQKAPVNLARSVRWLAVPILTFSACFFWHDSDELKIANGLAIVLALGALIVKLERGQLTEVGVGEYIRRLGLSWIEIAGDFASLFVYDLDWKNHPSHAAKLKSVGRGLILAVPVLVVFGALFASADDIFRTSLASMFSFDPVNLGIEALIFLGAAVVTGGLFRRLLLRFEPEQGSSAPLEPPTRTAFLGTTEIATIFGLLDLLFLGFVLIQLRYLFGGATQVAQVSGLSYAQYARHGFFELAAASGLVLPVVIGAQLFLSCEDRRTQSLFRLLAVLLIACVSVVLLSAFQRMGLYVSAYGLSELRLYTVFGMVWIAATLFWLAVIVVRREPDRLCFGALVAAFGVLLGLNFTNPDGLIARTNLDPSKKVDLAYLTAALSLDAAPAVSERANVLPTIQRDKLVASLKSRWDRSAGQKDWRSENLSMLSYEAHYRKNLGKP